jgi:hypothetical protein
MLDYLALRWELLFLAAADQDGAKILKHHQHITCATDVPPRAALPVAPMDARKDERIQLG